MLQIFLFSLLLSFQLVVFFFVFFFYPFFPWRSLNFLHSQICHIFLCDFWFYDILRKVFHIPRLWKKTICIFFFWFNGVKRIQTYVHVCISVCFSFCKTVCIFITKVCLVFFWYHLQFILVKGGVRWGSNFIFQADRVTPIPVIEWFACENTSEMKLSSITIKNLLCLHVWALHML